MSKSFDQIVEEHEALLEHDVPVEDVVKSLRDAGLTIVESMKAIRSLYNVNLKEAKHIITSHPDWAKTVHTDAGLSYVTMNEINIEQQAKLIIEMTDYNPFDGQLSLSHFRQIHGREWTLRLLNRIIQELNTPTLELRITQDRNKLIPFFEYQLERHQAVSDKE